MEVKELLGILARGEDGKHQFKANFSNVDSLASEMVAFSNSGGGQVFIGINDNGTPAGLTKEDMGRLNQMVSNAASQSVRPPINPLTENIQLNEGLVMVVTVLDGIRKPYMDNNGSIWTKSGADKRKVTAQEEMQRMFQSAGLIHGDEIPANGLTVADLDLNYFRDFILKEYGEYWKEEDEVSLPKLLENMNLAKDGNLNVAGALLFALKPQFRLPTFIIKAVTYPGSEIDEERYLDSEDLTGKIADVFQKAFGFISRNLKHIQGDQPVNSLGKLEIPKIVIEELLVNALIHRDYFISSPVRIFIFSDRVEIISPGHIPNNLTIENIKNGNSNIRNPILASFATKILPYRGLGSGIRRALREYPSIDFIDDKAGNMFKAIIHRN
jgi:ATP-dependent DNA helicase RecG